MLIVCLILIVCVVALSILVVHLSRTIKHNQKVMVAAAVELLNEQSEKHQKVVSAYRVIQAHANELTRTNRNLVKSCETLNAELEKHLPKKKSTLVAQMDRLREIQNLEEAFNVSGDTPLF